VPTIPQRNVAFRAETIAVPSQRRIRELSAHLTLVTSLHRLRQVKTMSWMDMSEYLLIETAARDRLDELRRAAMPRDPSAAAAPSALRAMLYVSAALRAKPRDIDRYIDYFGDTVLRPR